MNAIKNILPLEVDTLLGDATGKELEWKPKTNIKNLVKEMLSLKWKYTNRD